MDVRSKMTPAFQDARGGLFSSVEKADVGGSYQELAHRGVDLMGWADPFMPDRSIPDFVERAWVEAVRSDSAPHYTAPVGSPTLKRVLAEKLARQNDLNVDPERNILVTPGSDSGLYYSILPFVNPGDEVIIPSPCYPNNALNVRIMGGVPVFVPLDEGSGYRLDASAIASAVTSRTKMVLLTHPNNPTTTVFSREDLEGLCHVIIEHDLMLVVDQAFEDFTFGVEMVTPASLPGMFERTVTVLSLSKGLGLSGMRVGYVVCDDRIMDALYANAVSVIGATSTSAQCAAIAALKSPSYMAEFERAYDLRRRYAFDRLNRVAGVHMDLPASGFLAWVNVSALGSSSVIAEHLLEEARVSVNDGVNYGPGGEGHLRMVLGVYRDDQRVFDAIDRIAGALHALSLHKGSARAR